MFKSGIHLLLELCVLCFLSTVSLAQGFEAEISAFEQADLSSPPPAKPFLFVGSSSIRVWPDLAGDFPFSRLSCHESWLWWLADEGRAVLF
jgi:hypothetical protein